jgi:hypothetical protein
MTQSELRRLAQVGAGIRLGQLRQEIENIYRTFPELRLGESLAAAGPARGKRRRKVMSAAARRKIALAQKKRWAEWRKKKGKVASV